MRRGNQVLVRAVAGVVALAVVVQCGGSPTEKASPIAATTATTEVDGDRHVATHDGTRRYDPRGRRDHVAGRHHRADDIAPTTMPDQPTTTTAPPLVIDPNCPLTLHAAVIDRDRQRAWLCDHGVALPEFVITTAREQPDPGTYPVYAKSMHASSTVRRALQHDDPFRRLHPR